MLRGASLWQRGAVFTNLCFDNRESPGEWHKKATGSGLGGAAPGVAALQSARYYGTMIVAQPLPGAAKLTFLLFTETIMDLAAPLL